MKYPALMHSDGDSCAVLPGHGLAPEVLDAAERTVLGEPLDGYHRVVEEDWMEWVPRVKWCSRHPLGSGWGCDSEGWWHGHWFAVRENAHEHTRFTIIRHDEDEAQADDEFRGREEQDQ
jgi:hypothetical protein